MREAIRWLAGLALAVLLLAWVLKDQDPAQLGAALAAASLPGLVLASLLNVGHNLFRAWRWGALLRPVHAEARLRPMLAAILIGYMTTWVLPGRLGELVRPGFLSAREKVPIGPCMGSVLADRLLDAWAIGVLFAVGLILAPPPGTTGNLRAAGVGVLALGVASLALLALLARHREGLERRLAGRHGPVAWFLRAGLKVAAGGDALRRPALYPALLGHSLLAWGTIDLATWVGVRAAGADVPFGAVLVLMPLLAFGIALPTPAGAGGYHFAMRTGLHQVYGVPDPVAVGAGILLHLAFVLPVIALGLLLMKGSGTGWHDLRAVAGEVRRLGRAEAVP